MFKDALEKLLCSICPVITSPDWDSFKISLFWSNPTITREAWIKKLTSDSFAVRGELEDALTYVNIRSFFRFFPMDLFYAHWPSMRLYCPEKLFGRRCLYDTAWSVLATATAFVPPLPAWFSLSGKEKYIVAAVSKNLWKYEDDPVFEDAGRAMLAKLIDLEFLCRHEGRIFPSVAHRTQQKTRPRKIIRYTVRDMPGKVFQTEIGGRY